MQFGAVPGWSVFSPPLSRLLRADVWWSAQVDNGGAKSGFATLLPPIEFADQVLVLQIANGSATAASTLHVVSNGSYPRGDPVGLGGSLYLSNYATLLPYSSFYDGAPVFGLNISAPVVSLEQVCVCWCVLVSACGCVCGCACV